MISREDSDVYKYGLQVLLEMIFCVGTCLLIAVIFQAFLEIGLFLLIFIPLRSYAGGLHLSSFWSCYIFSCLTFLFIVVMAELIRVPGSVNILCILLCIGIIFLLYPVENKNREVDKEENSYFKRKLICFLGFDVVLTMFFLTYNMQHCIQVMMLTFMVVMVTMVVGKCTYMQSVKKRTLE